jgi:hypothetical protein
MWSCHLQGLKCPRMDTDILTLGNGNFTLSWNVRNQSPTYNVTSYKNEDLQCESIRFSHSISQTGLNTKFTITSYWFVHHDWLFVLC